MNLTMVFTCGSTSLVGAEGTPVKINTADGTVVPCSAAADEAIGIVASGAAVGSPVQVTTAGQTIGGILVSATVTRGQFATINAAGTGFTGGKVDAAVFMGVILENGVAGDYVQAFLFPGCKHKA